MTLRYLQIFAKVCEHMSMSEAAKELYISQSAVSQAIRELENHYELTLFMRDRRQLRLTRAGEQLLVYAKSMIQLNDNIDRFMRETKISPEIRLGVTDGLSEHYLPALLERYRAQNGPSRVVVHSGSRPRIEDALINNELDLALFEGPVRPRTFQIYDLFTDPFEVVCAQDSRISPLLEGEEPHIALEDLSLFLPLLLDRDSACFSIASEYLRSRGIALEKPSFFSSAASLCSAVRHDLGVGILPRTALQDAVGIKRIQVEGWCCCQKVHLIYHQKHLLFKQLKAFLEFILQDSQRCEEAAEEPEEELVP